MHTHHKHHDHGPREFDEAFWNARYGEKERIWSGRPNPQLVAEAESLAPGTALDVGCGEGADALWLAARGWDVTGVDISTVALARAAEHEQELAAGRAGQAAEFARDNDGGTAPESGGGGAAPGGGTAPGDGGAAPDHAGDSRPVRWQHHDLTVWEPPAESFDLVTAQYMHLPTTQRDPLFLALARAVAPGGTLLLVGHHPSDMHGEAPRPDLPDLYFTAEDIAGLLDDGWEHQVIEARPREASGPEGATLAVADTVYRGRRRS